MGAEALNSQETTMLVREVMTLDPITARVHMPTKQALQLLDQYSITMLPVVNAHRVILGVVSEADLIADAVMTDPRPHMVPPDVPPTSVAREVDEVMNRHPLTVRADTDVADATELMTSTAVKSLPVLDEKRRVIGIISRRDVVHALARSDERLASELGAMFQGLEVDWLVDVQDGVAQVTGPTDDPERELARAAAATVAGVVAVEVC
jgi:CBS-domain-containing membrane protein